MTGIVYWMDSLGSLVRAIPATGLVTAAGLVHDGLWISAADVESLPTSRSGVHAARLLETRLQRVPRSGPIHLTAVPEEIRGITHIGLDGTLFSATSSKLVMASAD